MSDQPKSKPKGYAPYRCEKHGTKYFNVCPDCADLIHVQPAERERTFAVSRMAESYAKEIRQLREQLAATERKYLDMERRHIDSERQLAAEREKVRLLIGVEVYPLPDGLTK